MSDMFDDRFFEESESEVLDQDEMSGLAGLTGDTFRQKPAGGQKKKKTRKKHPMVGVVASALVFGLVAGSATYAVNYTEAALASRMAENTETAESAQTSEAQLAVQENTAGSSSAALTSVATTETGGNMTVSEVAEAAMPSMVTISTMSVQEMQSFFGFGQSQAYEVEGAGTGILVGETDEELLIATNEHVINGATSVSVGFVDESVAEAYIKGSDDENDLAVIAVAKSDVSEETLNQIRVVAIGDSDALALGEQVVAIGNALGYGQSVTSGYVSALNRDLDLGEYTSSGLIQTDAAINAGNSGGALLNMQGELVGINEAKSSSSYGEATVDNMSFAIPVSKALPILQELMEKEARTRAETQGYLGVSIADVTEEYSQVYGMPVGVCFTGVQEGGAAEQAGILQGDVLVRVNDEKITTSEDLKEEMTYHSAGETVTLTVMRADNGVYVEKTIEVTLQDKLS